MPTFMTKMARKLRIGKRKMEWCPVVASASGDCDLNQEQYVRTRWDSNQEHSTAVNCAALRLLNRYKERENSKSLSQPVFDPDIPKIWRTQVTNIANTVNTTEMEPLRQEQVLMNKEILIRKLNDVISYLENEGVCKRCFNDLTIFWSKVRDDDPCFEDMDQRMEDLQQELRSLKEKCAACSNAHGFSDIPTFSVLTLMTRSTTCIERAAKFCRARTVLTQTATCTLPSNLQSAASSEIQPPCDSEQAADGCTADVEEAQVDEAAEEIINVKVKQTITNDEFNNVDVKPTASRNAHSARLEILVNPKTSNRNEEKSENMKVRETTATGMISDDEWSSSGTLGHDNWMEKPQEREFAADVVFQQQNQQNSTGINMKLRNFGCETTLDSQEESDETLTSWVKDTVEMRAAQAAETSFQEKSSQTTPPQSFTAAAVSNTSIYEKAQEFTSIGGTNEQQKLNTSDQRSALQTRVNIKVEKRSEFTAASRRRSTTSVHLIHGDLVMSDENDLKTKALQLALTNSKFKQALQNKTSCNIHLHVLVDG